MGWSRFFRRSRWDDIRAAELDSYLSLETDANIARGMTPEEARFAAHRKLGNLTRTRAPHSVSLTWYPALARTDWGIGTSGAYWMRDLRARVSGPGVTARVDATSGAVPSTFAGLVNTSGPLVTGDTPPLAGTFKEQAWRSGPAAARVAHVDVQLVNVTAATVRLARAGFATGEAGTITARTDGGTTLTLTDLAPGAPVTRNGVVVTHASTNGTARVSLASGTTTVTFG